MKYLFLLLISFSALAEPPPPANAFKGQMYGYEVAIYIEDIFSSQYGLRTVYFANGEWHYITSPSFYDQEIDTKEKADALFKQMVDQINLAVYEELNPISQEPNCCVERIQWLIENKLTIVENQLSVQ